jgi:hypothetical protein
MDCRKYGEDERETVLSYTVGSPDYQDNALMYVAGVPGDRFSLENPLDAMVPIRRTIPDLVNFSLVWRNEVRMLLAKIVSQGGTIPSSSSFALLGVPRRPREGWPVLADNVVLKDVSGVAIATDLRGLVQVGDWCYGVDYDSQKILILGANELNGLPAGDYTVATAPLDLGTGASLPPTAKGWGVAALRNNGADYIFALYNTPTTDSAAAYGDSILVRLKVNAGGALAYVDQLTLTNVLNGQGPSPAVADDGSMALFFAGIGGEQHAGSTNGNKSVLAKVTNIFGEAGAMALSIVLTGDPVPSSTPATTDPEDPLPTWDISGFVAAPRPGGVAYIRTGMYNATWSAENYTYYKTTVSKLFAITSEVTLWDAFQEGILEIAEEGAVGSSYSGSQNDAPCGIYFHDLLIAMGDCPEDDELYVFQGSKFKVCNALTYGARSLGFGLGKEDGQIGGYNVNSLDATWESERQIRDGNHHKHGFRPIRVASLIAAAAEGGEEGK